MDWTRFNEWCARHSTRGQIREGNRIRAAWSHTSLVVNNLTVPRGPLSGTDDLKTCGAEAVADARPYGLPWMFGLPEPWAPGSLEETDAALAEAGLRRLMHLTFMESEAALASPLRPLPADVEVRRVDSRGPAYDALVLNCRAYGMPTELAGEVVDAGLYFTDPENGHGVVVYSREGVPVSTATAVDLGDCVYVAAVATDPDHQRKGYAELAMRAALSAAPAKRSSLDATAMGEPLYARMGYRRGFQWNFWTAG